MKDFYDLYVLSQRFAFSGANLAGAIAATFDRRNTSIPSSPPTPLSPAFFAAEARATQWRRYLERNGLPGAPREFSAIGEALRDFLGSPLRALVDGHRFDAEWQAGGPWQ